MKVHIRFFVKPNRSAMETWIEDKFGGTRQNDFRVFVKANGDTRVFLKKSSERAMMLMSFNGRYANSLPYSFDKTLRDFSEEFGFALIAEDTRTGGWYCSFFERSR
ncbi:hypothetical protein K0U83_12720 [bacterium]|nr:hypothetical protein [bacterium]